MEMDDGDDYAHFEYFNTTELYTYNDKDDKVYVYVS